MQGCSSLICARLGLPQAGPPQAMRLEQCRIPRVHLLMEPMIKQACTHMHGHGILQDSWGGSPAEEQMMPRSLSSGVSCAILL